MEFLSSGLVSHITHLKALSVVVVAVQMSLTQQDVDLFNLATPEINTLGVLMRISDWKHTLINNVRVKIVNGIFMHSMTDAG